MRAARFPHGWWIIPGAILGAAVWAVLFTLVSQVF